MSKTNNLLYKGLLAVAWIIFVSLCIEAGGLMANFIVSIYNPDFVGNLYQKMDLTEIYQHNPWAFFRIYSFILVLALLKAYLFFIVIRLMHKLDFSHPFNDYVSRQISQLGYFTISIGLISYIAMESARKMNSGDFDLGSAADYWSDSQAYILMGAVLYIIATIFKKGVALQAENDLTV